MVSLKVVQKANKAYFQGKPFVAVAVGGTSGIGDYAVRALAKLYGESKAPLRVYIVGRNKSAYETIAADCAKVCPHGQFTFVQAADLAIIKEVDKAAAEVTRLETENSKDETPKIDLLLMTQAKPPFGGRDETSDGTDRNQALTCYSRIRLAMKLMPLLSNAGGSAHVVSIFGAGLEHTLIKDDLSLRKPGNYGVRNAGSHHTVFQTMVYERLAQQNPQVSFVNAYPGLVETPAISAPSVPGWFKVAWKLLGPVAMSTVGFSHDESGKRIVNLATDRFPSRYAAAKSKIVDVARGTDGQTGSGVYNIGKHNDVAVGKVDYAALRTDGSDQLIWDHVMKIFSEAEAGRKFTE